MIRQNFQAASSQGDWTMPFVIDCSKYLGETGWTSEEVVELHVAPDGSVGWDDYGMRRYDPTPPYVAGWHTWESSSTDGTGNVLLVPPSSVQIIVPAQVMASFGPGMVSIGVHFTRPETGQRITLLNGRLPIIAVP